MPAATAEWLRYWDGDVQRHYYFHVSSQETAWELPEGSAFRDGDEESAAMDTGPPSRPCALALPCPAMLHGDSACASAGSPPRSPRDPSRCPRALTDALHPKPEKTGAMHSVGGAARPLGARRAAADYPGLFAGID